jgi:hypothetical protein
MKSLAVTMFLCILFSLSAFSQEAQKIDEFENTPCDEYLGRIDVTIIQARDNSSSTVYVLIYEGKELKYNPRKNKTELVFPNYGQAKAKIRSIKKYLASRKFPVKRYSFVQAGFRENLTVEIWLVPQGAMPPKPTPTLTKMKYRKGKPMGFCIDCC